jgi:hypothetical protein
MFVLGEPVGTFWGYKYLGLLTQADTTTGVPTLGGLNQPGDMKFLDHNGDGTISPDDMHPIGNGQPDFIFGFDNTFTYKNWSLNIFLNGVIGSDVLNLMRVYTSLGNIRNSGGHHSKEYAQHYWTPSRPHTQYPRPGGGSAAISTYLLESGTFVRLQTVSLNYHIPFNKLGWNWIRNASVYLRGTNLYVWSNYSGFDPEGQFTGQADWNPNIDLGNYPRPRSMELGIRLGF